MASQEEDNKLECNLNVNKEQERNFVNVYKKYECILNNKQEVFEKKIRSLVEVWRSVGELNLLQSDIKYIIQIMDWAKLHALNIVLTAEWKDYKAKYEAGLLREIEKAQAELLKLNSAFSSRCEKLAKVVRNPWEDQTLERLLSSKDASIGPEEIEFFCVETAYLVSVRLKKLCESQCEDLALNLVTAFMNCNKLSKTQNFSLNATATQIWFIFDIYVALLYKFQENQKIVTLLKELSLEEGLQLIRRFAKKRVKISKIWRHCHRIAILASQVFVSTAAVKFSEEHREILENLVDCFISICIKDSLIENFTKSLRRISQLADAAGLYVFCDVVHRKAGLTLKPFIIEMYIRALTTDLNNLERQKNDNENDKVSETTTRLAGAFYKLADLLNEHVNVARECVLTAFSLEPTQERLKRIEELARRSGFQVLDTGQDWKCKLHPPVLPSDDIAWTCPDCGDWMCKPQLNVPLNPNTALFEALTTGDLGISPQLCDDLVVCLSNPRYQVLSWLLGWEHLHRLCVMYCNDPERTKNIVTELKFVDIDYSIFKGIKREPVDELAGIERGYEQYLDHEFNSDDQMSTISEDSASQDSRPYSLGSDGAGDIPSRLALPQTKSDPNTLKSLRMFRPNLKRPRPTEGGESKPEKIFKPDQHLQKPSTSTTSTLKASARFYLGGKTSSHHSEMNSLALNQTGSKPLPYYGYQQSNVPPDIQHLPYSSMPKYSQDAASKNGLVATLPPHGGQVATKELNQFQGNHPHPNNKSQLTTATTVPSTPSKPSNNQNKSKQATACSTQDKHTNNKVKIPITPTTAVPSTPSKSLPNGTLESSMRELKCLLNRTSEQLWKKPTPPAKLDSSSSRKVKLPVVYPKDGRQTLAAKKISTKETAIRLNLQLIPSNLSASSKKEKGSQCNTFKGISVQDIINKSIGNCDDSESPQIAVDNSALLLRDMLNKSSSMSNSNDYSSCVKSRNELPKNKSLTESIKNSKLHERLTTEKKDCVTQPNGGEYKLVEACKNVNSSSKSTGQKIHSSNVQSKGIIETKELKVVLHRLNSSDNVKVATTRRSIGNSKRDRCRAPPKRSTHKRHKSHDKSENKAKGQAPKRVQTYKPSSSPLQDINPRVPSQERDNQKKVKNSSKPVKLPDNMNPRVMLERLPADNRNYARSVLANVPGLNDFEMLRPSNVDQIVNVVQISGGRPTSSVTAAPNTQTSTQVSPHIQRIGQPRTDKPDQATNNAETTSTSTSSLLTSSSTTTTVKPTTSQPSTLINILSQQIIRPGQSNCVRTRPSPLINILSQQIIRPTTAQMQAQKVPTTNSVSPAEQQVNNTAKPPTSEQTVTSQINTVKNSTTTVKTTPTSGQGTILQFICKSTLPKFQQAFGKTVYQSSTETTEATTTNNVETPGDASKKPPTKNIPVNMQPLQGSVIYTRQMPVGVGQTINLLPPGRGQVFRIATSNSDQISLVKDTVIHSKMSALLAAALQGKQTKNSEPPSDSDANAEDASGTRVTVTRPTLVQNARIVKPVLQIPSNVIRTSPQSNLSSTTLEQLREFDMVYKQIKERSSTTTPTEANNSQPENNETTSQRISVTYVNQGQKYTQLSPVVVVSSYCNLQPAASPALSVTSQGSSSPCVTPAPTPTAPKVASKSSKGKTLKSTTTHTSKSSPIPKPQQKPQEDEHTTQRIFDILAEYAEQLRNSPDLNNKPAPRRRSNPPTNPNQNSKRKKSSGSKKSGQCSSMVSEADTDDQRTMGSEDSSCGVVQLSMQDDEQPQVQSSINTTESNDSSSNSRQQLILTDSSGNNQTRNLIIADSSVGEALKIPNTAVLVPGNYIMPVSMVKGGQQIAVVSGGSKILATVPARSGPNMLLFQSFLNQNRKAGVPTTVKYSTIQPLSGISSQSLAGVSAQPPVILPPNSHNLTAVTLGQPLTLKKVDDSDRVNTELLLTISQARDSTKPAADSIPQPDSSTSISDENLKIEESVIQDGSSEKVFHHTFTQKSIIATPIATPVIAQTSCIKDDLDEPVVSQNLITMNITSNNMKDDVKVTERVQSVLVTACTSNGPMLSHTPPRYRKPSESGSTNNDVSSKGEFLHNGEKNNSDQKHFQGNTVYYSNKTKKITTTTNPQRLDRELHQLCLQRKQAALERELRLQKSLSEECEDLGVDEPSTSDLFPEADLLFDSNHSPSFDQSSQDLLKRTVPTEIVKDDAKPSSMTLFSDDDNSSSLRTDLFEYVEYQTAETELEYDPGHQHQQLTNGQSSTSNESGSSGEDNTLIPNCASMSDVTLNSPISPPDLYSDNIPATLNKYKFKYSNRKKGERHKQTENWTTAAEVSSSEDTTGSTELGKRCDSHSISCGDDDLSDGSYKVVRVAISKTDLLKDEESCEELHCEDDLDCSPSGRGARRSVKKLCSCCNGNQDGGASRKRSNSRPHTPAPHKKAFLNKKR